MGRWLSKLQAPSAAGQEPAVGQYNELGHRQTVQQITRLLQSPGWALVESSTLGEIIGFARDADSGGEVPGGIIVYTRDELAMVIGAGADAWRLVHEGKKHGARVTGRIKANA